MNIINKYFDFLKRSLCSYSLLFLDDENGTKYIDAFISTFIDTYYYHILNTYYENTVTKFNEKIIVKELKGKMLELFEDIREQPNEKEEKNLIENCYQCSLLSIVISKSDFSECSLVEEYKNRLLEVLADNRNVDLNNNDLLNRLASLLRKNTDKERKFFASLNNEEYNLIFHQYRESKVNYKVDLEYHIDGLANNYTKKILDKNFNNKVVSKNKFKTTINLLCSYLLGIILSNEKMDYYFIDLPLEVFNEKEELEEIISWIDNERIKERIVFIVSYNEYATKKSFFKNLTDYSFALSIDFSRTIVIDKRLAEIESFDLFAYIIIDGVKDEDRNVVENYVIKGKEMFMNELNMM